MKKKKTIKVKKAIRVENSETSVTLQPVKKNNWLRNLFFVSIFCIGIGVSSIFIATKKLVQLIDIPYNSLKEIGSEIQKPLPERMNILLLGIGGEGHEGPLLTDSMLFISLTKDHPPVLVSLPRDLWSDTLKDKLNTAYYYGETQKRTGGGIGFTKEIVREITGQNVDRIIVVDFSLFKKSIDVIGGVDVNVTESFSDPEYPIEGMEQDLCNGDPRYRCRYHIVTFNKGVEHMDGARALTYVRSRHAEGDEGTDFSRGKRQQAVLEAIKKQLVSSDMLHQPERFIQLYKLATNNIKTDSSVSDLVAMGKFVIQSIDKKPLHVSLEQVLMNPNPGYYENRYVLIPSLSLTDFQKYIEASLSGSGL